MEGGPNAGEKRLIDYLKENLPDDYYIVPNGEYAMKSPQGMVNYFSRGSSTVWRGRILILVQPLNLS